jgi:hypothetical protein
VDADWLQIDAPVRIDHSGWFEIEFELIEVPYFATLCLTRISVGEIISAFSELDGGKHDED